MRSSVDSTSVVALRIILRQIEGLTRISPRRRSNEEKAELSTMIEGFKDALRQAIDELTPSIYESASGAFKVNYDKLLFIVEQANNFCGNNEFGEEKLKLIAMNFQNTEFQKYQQNSEARTNWISKLIRNSERLDQLVRALEPLSDDSTYFRSRVVEAIAESAYKEYLNNITNVGYNPGKSQRNIEIASVLAFVSLSAIACCSIIPKNPLLSAPVAISLAGIVILALVSTFIYNSGLIEKRSQMQTTADSIEQLITNFNVNAIAQESDNHEFVSQVAFTIRRFNNPSDINSHSFGGVMAVHPSLAETSVSGAIAVHPSLADTFGGGVMAVPPPGLPESGQDNQYHGYTSWAYEVEAARLSGSDYPSRGY